MAEEPWRRERLVRLCGKLAATLQTRRWQLAPSITPIQPLIVGDNALAVSLSDSLAAAGILVPAIRPPTVPEGTARLRISLSAAHTERDVESLVAALHEAEKSLSDRALP